MIRVSTMIWLGLVGASSAFLFKTSYEVQSLTNDLRGLNQSILREQDSIRVMHAEWAFLNQPSRLQALTDQYTKLRPIVPMQLVASASVLPMRQPSFDGDQAMPAASLVAQNDALPSFGPVPLPSRRPGEAGVLLAAAAPMSVQTAPEPVVQSAAAPIKAAAPIQVASLDVPSAPAAISGGWIVPQASASSAAAGPPPVREVAVADAPIRPIVVPRRPAASLETVARALTPTRAAASDDSIGALIAGLDGSRGIR